VRPPVELVETLQDTVMNELADRLRGTGHRLTPQRELILRAVEKLGHATPDEVLTEVRAHSQAVNASTVYRNLEVLEQLGLVKHAHLTDRAPTYHSVGGHEHFHLVCRKCERVISVEDHEARSFLTKLEADFGFRADVGHLTVHGLCENCKET